MPRKGPSELLFGTAGIPVKAKGRPTEEGILVVRELGLGAMELEFVRNVHIKKDKAAIVKRAAQEANIFLTCHGQYWVNLNAIDKVTLRQSIKRVIDASRIADLCEAWSICYHSAYRMDMPPEKVYANVKSAFKEILKVYKDEGLQLWLRPEIAGKLSQFGNLQEVINLSQDFSNHVLPCIDIAHLHATAPNKGCNTLAEFKDVLREIEKGLGKEALQNMHIHCEGVQYTPKGEREHINLKQSDMNYQDWLKALKEFKAKGIIISESPNIEGDALLMQETYRKLH
ncbi:TIM barrel protein [Candidatus Woesearchaeota archaeon]|nr:TIM barrel protein [Candidatus Woesearchaeota archaeon]